MPTKSAIRTKTIAALQGLVKPPPRVCPEELQKEKEADRIALWSAWDAMRADDAARKALPSRSRPPSQLSEKAQRLIREAVTAARQ